MSMRQIFEIPGYKEILDGLDSLWKRAVLRTTAKGSSQSFTNTRNTTDGYSAARILPSAKAFGKAVTKRKRNKLWGRYVPCEYIESTGTQLIDTDVIADNQTEVEFDYAIYSSGSVYIFGTRVDGTQYFTISGSQTGGTNTNFVNGSSANVNVGNRVSAVWNRLYQKVTANNGTVTWNATNKDTQTSNSGTYSATIPTLTETIKLFTNGSEFESRGRIYACKLRQNGVLVRDYVPVKDVVDNVYGMFDRVNNKFYGNAGTGAFAAGSLIQPIAYAESDSTAYADTGVVPAGKKISAEVRAKAPSVPSSGVVFVGSTKTDGVDNIRVGGYSNKFRFKLNNKGWYGDNWDANYHTYKINRPDGSWFDNTQVFSDAPAAIVSSNTNPVLLFADYGASAVTYMARCSIAYAKIWDDNILIRDYLPVRIGTQVELLDLVSWTFATRTGTFTAGADIPYTQLCPDILETNVGDALYGQYGKNLFDKDHRTRVVGYFANTGTTWSYSPQAYSNKIPCKPNTTYTARYNGNSTQAVLGFGSCNTDVEPSADTPTVTVTQAVRKNSPTISTPVTITTGPNDKWLIVAYNIAEPQHTDMADNLQIEEGSTATPYEPYHFGLHPSGEQTVFMGEQGVVDLGTLNWSNPTSTTGMWLGQVSDMQGPEASSDRPNAFLISNTYTPDTQTSIDTTMHEKTALRYRSGSSVFIAIRDSRFTTSAEFKASLSGKYLFYQRSTDASFIPPQSRTITTFLPSATSFIDAQKASNNAECDWGIMVVDGVTGTYTIASDGYIGQNSSDIYITDSAFTGAYAVDAGEKSNYFERSTEATWASDVAGMFCLNNSQIHMRIDNASTGVVKGVDDRQSALTKIKAYLKKLYDEGHPVILVMKRATPAITTLSLTPFELNTDATRTLISQGADGQSLPVQAQYLGI